MHRTVESAFCAALGVLSATSLWQALHAHHLPQAPKVSRVAVTVRAASPVAVSVPEPVAANNAILPLRTHTSSPRKSMPKKTPQLPQPAPVQETVVLPFDLPTLEQPAIGLPPQAAAPLDLPLVPSSQAPPAPPEPQDPATFALIDRPGGEIIVLGLLLDDQGVALDAKVLVASRYPLGDITLVLANIGKQWSGIEPPLEPGEKRWIQLRLDYGNKNPVYDPIP